MKINRYDVMSIILISIFVAILYCYVLPAIKTNTL